MAKTEIVNTYLLDKPDVVVPMDREEFYKEQEEEIKELPDAFTGDIKFLLKEYRPRMEKFIADFTKK